MKVYIGPHVKWIGPYQIADWLQKVGVSEDRCHKIGNWLSSTWVGDFLEKIHSNQKRTVKVHINNYDVWSFDHTLALIVHPALLMLQQNKHGAPFTDDEDVPEELRSTNAALKQNEYDTDEFHFQRWDYILGEMIWAFTQAVKDDDESEFFEHPLANQTANLDLTDQIKAIKIDMSGLAAHQMRKQNGFRLFGKYYQALWD